MSRTSDWLRGANMAHIFVLSISPVFAVLLIAVFLRNPTVDQVPLGEPIVVQVQRECSAAQGPMYEMLA